MITDGQVAAVVDVDLTPVLVALDVLKDEALGKWVIIKQTNVMTRYKQDGATVLKQFQLSDTVNPPLTQRVPL